MIQIIIINLVRSLKHRFQFLLLRLWLYNVWDFHMITRFFISIRCKWNGLKRPVDLFLVWINSKNSSLMASFWRWTCVGNMSNKLLLSHRFITCFFIHSCIEWARRVRQETEIPFWDEQIFAKKITKTRFAQAVTNTEKIRREKFSP